MVNRLEAQGSTVSVEMPQNWMRRKDTIEYIGFWEMLTNPGFNVREFEYIKSEAGTNRFVMITQSILLLIVMDERKTLA